MRIVMTSWHENAFGIIGLCEGKPPVDYKYITNYEYVTCGPFYLHGLTLIPAWISNYMPGKVWGEITYPFLNFNGCTVEV